MYAQLKNNKINTCGPITKVNLYGHWERRKRRGQEGGGLGRSGPGGGGWESGVGCVGTRVCACAPWVLPAAGGAEEPWLWEERAHGMKGPPELGVTAKHTSKEGPFTQLLSLLRLWRHCLQFKGKLAQKHTTDTYPGPTESWLSACSKPFLHLPEGWCHRGLSRAPSLAQPYLCFARPLGPKEEQSASLKTGEDHDARLFLAASAPRGFPWEHPEAFSWAIKAPSSHLNFSVTWRVVSHFKGAIR